MIIIDDIDMINQQNQQVFCDYIDRYKNNVCFLLAGSNKQKIIENIQSRVHMIRIHAPSPENLKLFMERVLEQEQLRLTTEAKDYISFVSGTSIRCILKHLEKIKIYTQSQPGQTIDLELSRTLCSTISMELFETYFLLLKTTTTNEEGTELKRAIQILYSVCDYGYSVIDIFYYLFQFVEQTSILMEDEKYKITMILCHYITIVHNIHEDIVETALFTREVYNIFRHADNNVHG